MNGADDNDIEEVRREAERQRRATEQALRRIEEQEKELGQFEDHITGLEEQLAASQSFSSRQAAELRSAQDQVAVLERELRELRDTRAAADAEPEHATRKSMRRSKTEGAQEQEATGGYRAAEALEAAKREHEEAMRAKQAEVDKHLRTLASLQEQHMQLQQYCEDLRDASQEIQGFLHAAESENSQLQQEISEMREVMEAHHLQKALKSISDKRGSLQLSVFADSDSLAHELQQEEPNEDQADVPVQKTRSVSIVEEEETPKPRKKPALRRSSSNVAASKLAALQEEYEEKFESQSQQLQSALQNKERIEKEKQEAIDSLQKQIEELKGKMGESGGDSLAGLFKMMSRIKELTTEASDAVLLGFASPEDVALPPAAPKREEAARAEQALKFSSVATVSDVRSRLQGRRQKKAAGEAAQ